MRKYRMASGLLALLLVLSLGGCARTENAPEGGYQLYFPRSRDSSYGSALGSEPWQGSGTALEKELLEELLAGPTEEGLVSPFPKGVTLQSMTWDEEVPGLLHVEFSEQYGGLTDITQTLADACVVLTLSQKPEVEQVEIRVSGYFGPQRSRTLSVEQMELNSLLS